VTPSTCFQWGIAPDTTVCLELEVVSSHKGVDALSRLRLAISLATETKESGNESFRDGDILEAQRSYLRAYRTVDRAARTSAEKEETKPLRLSLSLNLAACGLKETESHRADGKFVVKWATRALNIDASHDKALYRRGLGHLLLDDDEAAVVDLSTAHRLAPDDKLVAKALAKARQAGSSRRKQAKRMFSGLGSDA
jgi:peptidyl-prolyl isomerase D